METKETLSKSNTVKTVLENPEYFKYIFKKTEKIACAVFYILRHERVDVRNESVADDLENATRDMLDSSLMSLNAPIHDNFLRMQDLKFTLIALDSELRIAHASGLISAEFLSVFLNETDSVVRTLRRYMQTDKGNILAEQEIIKETQPKKSAIELRKQSKLSQHESSGIVELPRRDRILEVIKDKGEASIKDVSEVVTDCSEKTIQRELINLIKDNLIIREGERRWSKYKAV